MAESVHGVDVSWMSKHSSANSKDHHHHLHVKHFGRKDSPPPPPVEEAKPVQNGQAEKEKDEDEGSVVTTTSSKPIPPRPKFSRSASSERTATVNGGAKTGSPSPNSRRNSWLSSISSKFSSSPATHNPPTTPPTDLAVTAPPSADPVVPAGPRDPKNAILPHAQKVNGDAPYTPAPPKNTQPSFLQNAFRRLSSSNGQSLSTHPKGHHSQHGLCERRILNVDHNRERCAILELDQSKLRRVAFSVDVEIASGPRYIDEDHDGEEEMKEKKDTSKKIKEKGEGLALKNPEPVVDEKEAEGVIKSTREEVPSPEENDAELIEAGAEKKDDAINGDKDTKKKEKKKRSEEERKARKEKKRKLAEANGTLPVELIKNASDTSLAGPGTPKTQVSPTTDPVRIYRRCCQLRESPILKRITEQLGNKDNQTPCAGIVHKLDLTGYWLQLPDLITLSDYFAVVPIREVVMENCGLTDEGVRVILAGLLASRGPDWESKVHRVKSGEAPQGGFVERVIFKNNPKIGKDGWRYIATFITMCRSLKSLDLSQIPFPQSSSTTPPVQHETLSRTTTASSMATASTVSTLEPSCVLGKAIGSRLAGKEFELLNMAETGLTTDQLCNLIDGVMKSGLRRLGVAGNNISAEGMQHIVRYIHGGVCEGLDLGGNDLKDQLNVVADALTEDNALYALSLANCNLTPESLWSLFPALAKLSNFKFIDLSQNHGLFNEDPSALSLLRRRNQADIGRYLPKMLHLKRIHLTDVSMTPEQAIALAEILPECPTLAHVNIMENPRLAALANAKDEAGQEEACALYASLMAAVRVSQTIICVDIEVPSPESSEIVKALAKQVVAYCLWNMERGPVAEISEAVAAITEPHGGEKQVAVPDVLLHLVGHVEGLQENDGEDEAAPDEDYVIGGTGVVKALGICLRNRTNDSRRPSADRTFSDRAEHGIPGSATPKTGSDVSGGKAKDMSKNLLGSARKIRARLQPALVKESRGKDTNSYHQTLEGMIKRFEDEYPETRLEPLPTTPPLPDVSLVTNEILDSTEAAQGSDTEQPLVEDPLSDAEDGTIRPVLSRHNSDVSIASRALSQEEGRIHRFGHQFRRDIFAPDLQSQAKGQDFRPDSSTERRGSTAEFLRAWVDGLGGEEIKRKILSEGYDKVIGELNDEASTLRREMIEQDPEGWERFVESQEKTARNLRLEGKDAAVAAERENKISTVQ